jgi:hypothetical protein
MHYRRIYFIVLILFLFISCLHSGSTAPSVAIHAWIKISSGKATARINGKINENLYYYSIFDNQTKNEKPYDNPAIAEGTVTKSEIKYLGTGDEYKFSVLPTEVVTINIISSDGNDVEVIAYQYGKEKKYIVKGTNILGLSIAFQNR